jgi:CMP-N-acetylneuraminic acid synthetase
MRVGEGRLEAIAPAAPMRRQEKQRLVARNGPAVLATRSDVIRRGSLYGGDCRPLEMTRAESLDVDVAFDLEIAAFLLARRERS